MAGTVTRTVLLKIRADDGDTEEKLDQISAKADELRAKHPDLKVRIDTAEALAKMAVFREELKDATKTVTVKVKAKYEGDGGFMDSLLGKASGSESQGILGNIGSVFSLSGGSLGGTAGGVGAIAAVGAIAQGLTAATVAAGGLAAAFAPIATAIMPRITSDWDKWSKSIASTPDAKKAIGAAGSAFQTLLTSLTPLVITMMPQLTRLFRDIGKSAQSGGLNTFLEWMSQNAPKAFDAVAKGFRIAGGAIHFLMPLISSVSDIFKIFFHLLDGGFDLLGGVIDLFTGHWKAAGSEFKSVEGNIVGIFHDLWDGVQHVLGDLVGLFKGLPGKVMSALSNLGSMLFSAGSHVISMFASGIRSAIGAVTSAIGSVASEVWSHIPHSPAKKGPLSGAGSPDIAGRRVSEMFAGGIRAGIPSVMGSSSAMAHAAGLTAGGGARLAGAGGPVVVTLDFQGADQALVTALKKIIRVRGGDPNVLGR